MAYFFNGFFAGLVTSGTCFIVQAWPTTEIAKKNAVTHQTGFFSLVSQWVLSL